MPGYQLPSLAYEDRAIPRLNGELADSDVSTRQRAIMTLCDYLHDPHHIAAALNEDIVKNLMKLLKDPDLSVRLKSTECFYIIGGHAVGKQKMREENVILALAELFDDAESSVRLQSHRAIEIVSMTEQGSASIIEADLIFKLVSKLKPEVDEIKELILETLHSCMKVDTRHTLECNAIEVFVELLSHDSSLIRGKACKCILDICYTSEGKYGAVNSNCIPLLIKLLSDKDPLVRAKSAGALMFITITTKGKNIALKEDAIRPLLLLLDDDTSEVVLNALKTLTCLAESPSGRMQLLEHISKIKELNENPIPSIARASKIAIEEITWKP